MKNFYGYFRVYLVLIINWVFIISLPTAISASKLKFVLLFTTTVKTKLKIVGYMYFFEVRLFLVILFTFVFSITRTVPGSTSMGGLLLTS